MAMALSRGSAEIPETAGSVQPSSRDVLDHAVEILKAHKDEWVALPVGEYVAILRQLRLDTLEVSRRWVEASCAAKGFGADARAASEEWLAGPYCVLRNLRLLQRSLQDIERHGRPRIPGPVAMRDDGQTTARVVPADLYDRLLYPGFRADIWMEPGISPEELATTQASTYHDADLAGRVVMILGAGNVSSIGPMDSLYRLFVHRQVVLLKMNPVNAYLGPFIEEAFAALTARGFLRVVYGGAAEGSYLCHHPEIDEIHITGSDKTHDAIVFGIGPDGSRRKTQREPLLSKPITSELGNVSPVIVVPGPWSSNEISFQATNLVSMLTNNAGFNCNATRVIVTHAGWTQRPDLLAAIREHLQQVPPRKAYYPGAAERFEAFAVAHPEAEQYGEALEGNLPWMFVPDVDAADGDDLCFTTEAFCGVFAETALKADTEVEFIDRAVAFANETLWGSLNATLLVHPTSLRQPETAAAVERAVADLRYGTVGINHWTALGYALVAPTWGAFPGHELHDIGSGRGVVHNTLMFTQPQKTVLRGPFVVRPTPPWFVTHGRSEQLAPKLARFEARPSLAKLPGILWSALRG